MIMLKSLSKKRKITFIILTLILICNLAFIWGNSTLPPSTSSNESNKVYDKVGEVVDSVLGEGTMQSTISHYDFRKLTHFLEFFALSFEVCLIMLVTHNFKWKYSFIPVVFGFFVAVIDEVIQIFSGRSCSFIDVMIDTGGSLFATLCFVALFSIVVWRKKRKQKKDEQFSCV